MKCLALLKCGANVRMPRKHHHHHHHQQHRRRPTILSRSGMRDEVDYLNAGKSPVEELSGETNTVVADVMDIDRTPELLTWLFSGLFKGRADRPDPPSSTASSSSSSPTSPSPLSSPSPPVAAVQRLGAEGGPPTPSSPSPARTTTTTSLLTLDQNGNVDQMPTNSISSEARTEACAKNIQLATVGGGCFWCIEACFRELEGVISVVSGYAGGHVPNPTYQQVCSKTTGHAEVVQITYDASVLSYTDILQIFMAIHDPTTPNRSGNDIGPQYRSIILTHDGNQAAVAAEVLAEANRALWFGRTVCTEVAPLHVFYASESYHQRYYSRNPGAGYCMFVVRPKLQEFRRKFAKRLRRDERGEV
ncbi:hypothetical protein Vretimale_19744 [Volvox reticuliferus]|uniref:peptide-methionine (S)-S-oxide reductase n=1 Tax=Volvox reticuliferus TaxID=1737510 RepID=A0A8J4GZM5_9CHLO|nr:hypothetical protein Vretifemale_20718 [Volvox reticuliferus]GIM17241.1 hypothetical protein Vretimale_19744 [Volvox reticuliferus]